MTAGAPRQPMTAAEYLAWEREQVDKHEFHRGEVYAMAGGSPRHNALTAAVARELRAALRGRGRRVLSSDQRIAPEGKERYVYADTTVVCGTMELQTGTTDVVTNPSVVVEVLSKSTERYDRGQKWEGYQRIASLTDYLLIHQAEPRIEHFQRSSNGAWTYRAAGRGGKVTLSQGVDVMVDAVFEDAFELEDDS